MKKICMSLLVTAFTVKSVSAQSPTLQTVTDNGGNTTTNSIKINAITTVGSRFTVAGYNLGYFDLSNNSNSSINLTHHRSDGASVFEIDGHTMRTYFGGNVGIGTTTPACKLHTYAANNSTTASAFLASDYYGPVIGVKTTGTAYYALNVASGVTAPDVNSSGSSSLLFVRADGNIGINNTSPVGKLHIIGAATPPSGATFVIGATTGANLRMGNDVGYSWIQAHGSLPLYINDLGNNLILNRTAGNVGIGTATPGTKLDVNGGARFTTGVSLAYGADPANYYLLMQPFAVSSNHISYRFVTTSTGGGGSHTPLIIDDGGNVGINTTLPPQSELAVKGTITAMKIKVTQTGWADYVFDSSYQLAPLQQVQKYIEQNKHLPDVPSAATISKEGINIGDNQVVLLKKIEELTLYIIQQNKKQEALTQKVEEQSRQIKELQTKMK